MYKIIWPVLFPKETVSKFGGVSLIEKFQFLGKIQKNLAKPKKGE